MCWRTRGLWITYNGAAGHELHKAKSAIEGAFWRNSRLLQNRLVPLDKRLARLDSAALGIIRSRGAIWPASKAVAEAIDAEQFKLTSWMMGLRRATGETAEQYAIRRARALGGALRTQWSKVLCHSTVAWLAHLQRHPESISARALRTQGTGWVQDRRDRFTNGLAQLFSRTRTRTGRGKVIRWDDGWSEAANPEGASEGPKLRTAAEKLHRHLKLKDRGRHPLAQEEEPRS